MPASRICRRRTREVRTLQVEGARATERRRLGFRSMAGTAVLGIDPSGMELEKVVADTHQGPFLLHARQPATEKLAKAAGVFDLPEDRFDDRLATPVQAPPAHGGEGPLHPLFHAEARGWPPAGRHRNGIGVLAAPGRDERLD